MVIIYKVDSSNSSSSSALFFINIFVKDFLNVEFLFLDAMNSVNLGIFRKEDIIRRPKKNIEKI